MAHLLLNIDQYPRSSDIHPMFAAQKIAQPEEETLSIVNKTTVRYEDVDGQAYEVQHEVSIGALDDPMGQSQAR